MPSQTRPEYDIDVDDNLAKTSVTHDTVEATADVNDYKYPIGTIH